MLEGAEVGVVETWKECESVMNTYFLGRAEIGNGEDTYNMRASKVHLLPEQGSSRGWLGHRKNPS